jgi:DNA-binding transcriptional LysR family regulator
MAIIEAMDLRGLDLNLLIPLRVLLTERHVTRAAEKLGITQPAMSASLARLRTLFDDQLLVRGPKGLAPTARAQQLMDQLDQFVAMIEQMVALPTEFVPDTSRRTFTLIGTDFIETLLLPSLMADLAIEAPSLQVVFRPPDPKNLEALMSEGEIDLAVAYLPDAPKGLITSVAFRDRFVCIARRDHPQLSTDHFPLDLFVDLQHVQVLPRNLPMYGMPIDAALGALGFVRRVALWQRCSLAPEFSSPPRHRGQDRPRGDPTAALGYARSAEPADRSLRSSCSTARGRFFNVLARAEPRRFRAQMAESQGRGPAEK